MEQEIKNPKLSNIVADSIISFVIGGLVGVGVFAVGWICSPLFLIMCGPTISVILGTIVGGSYALANNQRINSLVSKLQKAIKRIDKKIDKETDEETLKDLRKRRQILTDNLAKAKKAANSKDITMDDED